MKPPLNRDELAKLVEEALDGGGYLMFRFGHGQIRQLRPDETEVVLAALKTPAPEVERRDAERYRYLRNTPPWQSPLAIMESSDIIDHTGVFLCQEALDIAIDARLPSHGPQSSGS